MLYGFQETLYGFQETSTDFKEQCTDFKKHCTDFKTPILEEKEGQSLQGVMLRRKYIEIRK